MEDHTDGKQKHGSEGLDRLIHGELTTAHLSSRAMWRVLPGQRMQRTFDIGERHTGI